MSKNDLIKCYTGDQLKYMAEKYILGKSCGITDFNDSSKVKALIDFFCDTMSVTGFDFKTALKKAIEVALYEGINLKIKEATPSVGFVRIFRKPCFTLKYNGMSTNITITITSTQISVSCYGASGDAFTFLFSEYDTSAKIVDAINLLPNWSANSVSSVLSENLYKYDNIQMYGKTTYLNQSGFDVMDFNAIEKVLSSGIVIMIDSSLYIMTTAEKTIPAGDSGVQVPCKTSNIGADTALAVGTIDTLENKGSISYTNIDGAYNDTVISGGRNEETNTERKQRFFNTINSLNAGTKSGICIAIEKVQGVNSCDMAESTPAKGSNTIYVDTGSPVIEADILAEILKVLYGDPNDSDNYPGKNMSGLEYIITTPDILVCSLNVLVTRLSSVKVSLEIIRANVQAAIESYVNSLKLGRDVILSEASRLGRNSNKAIYDLRFVETSNIVVASGQIARTGAAYGGAINVTVSVQEGES